jgi:hypothetical protein
MKKLLLLAAVATLLGTLTGCGSLRTPSSGQNSKNVYYYTFFGISIESAVYGDGVIVDKK